MKTLMKLLLLTAVSALLSACAKSNDFAGDELMDNPGVEARSASVMVTVPFTVDYLGTYTFVGPNEERCGANPPYRNVIVDGVGVGTHVGRSTIHFDFCFDSRDGTYGNGDNFIVAANGDTLFVSIEGQVIPGRLDDHPEYVKSYWRDPFVILGGTGRFEGATGGGWSDDYNSSEDPNSHHHWEGTITMVVGKP